MQFKEGEVNMSDPTRGLYDKFHVRRTDGQSAPGQKHDGCKYFVVPKTRTDWWLEKINGNKSHDIKNIETLSSEGWKVVVIWECELKYSQKKSDLSSLLVAITE